MFMLPIHFETRILKIMTLTKNDYFGYVP